MSDFLTLARERYFCRKFSDAPVEPEKIDALIAAAVAAPTAVDKQPWHAWIIQSPDALETVRENTPYGFGAPLIVAVGAKEDEAWVRSFDGRNFADVDASIVATHIMLAAYSLDLGSTWVGKFDAGALKQAFPQMQGYDLIALFPLGYPADDAEPAPRHTMRKPADELVSRI